MGRGAMRGWPAGPVPDWAGWPAAVHVVPVARHLDIEIVILLILTRGYFFH